MACLLAHNGRICCAQELQEFPASLGGLELTPRCSAQIIENLPLALEKNHPCIFKILVHFDFFIILHFIIFHHVQVVSTN